MWLLRSQRREVRRTGQRGSLSCPTLARPSARDSFAPMTLRAPRKRGLLVGTAVIGVACHPMNAENVGDDIKVCTTTYASAANERPEQPKLNL